jgi:hypothetical protein
LARDITMPKHGNCGKRPYYYAPPTASANWRYITDEDRTGPRKNEIMLSTMDAKKAFALETSDISALTGLRHPQSGYRSGAGFPEEHFSSTCLSCAGASFPHHTRCSHLHPGCGAR